MPGGSWTPGSVTDPGQRPGLYANLQAKAAALIGGGTTGIVAIIGTADWGPDNVVTSVASEADIINAFGPSTGAGTLFYAAREALRGEASAVLAYRAEGSAKAKATKALLDGVGGTALTLTAKYNGARANGFVLDVVTNTQDGTKKDVKISEGGVLLETFTGATNQAIADLINGVTAGSTASKYVTAAVGGGTFVTNVAAQSMVGGNSGLTLIAGDYTTAEAVLEPLQWDGFQTTIGVVANAAIITSIATWIKGLRNNGQRVFVVFGSDAAETQATAVTNASTYGNNEGIEYVWPGVNDENNTLRAGNAFSARIAGLIAAHGTKQSLTHQPLPFVTSLEHLPTNAEVKAALAGGVLTLTAAGASGTFQVEKGITTLTTLGATTPAGYKKIRPTRIIDQIVNALGQTANTTYIGSVLNNAIGQQIVINAIKAYLETLQASGLVQPGFTVTLDPANPSTADRMFVLIGVTPVDTIDYIYLTINIGS